MKLSRAGRGLTREALRLGHSLESPYCRLSWERGRSRQEGVVAWRTESGDTFAEWIWDGTELRARNDRYGFQPLFYAAEGSELRISPSLVRLLALGVAGELDVEGLSVFSQLGFFIGEDTPFRTIRMLPPNGRLRWKEGALEVSGQYLVTPPSSLSREAAMDGYIQLFADAIRRTRPEAGDFALPLSGGRDSRHILLELCRQGSPPDVSVTVEHPAGHWPPRPDEDAILASQVSEVAGVRHVVLRQPRSRLRAELRKNVLTHFCADEHGWSVPLLDFLAGTWTRVYDGIAGDVLSAGLFLTEERLKLMETGRVEELARSLCCDGYLSTAVARTTELDQETAVSRIAAELARHREAANPVGSFFFWNRTRREIALIPLGILAEIPRVEMPYLDHDLWDFLSSLPARLLLDRRFHTDTISRAYPEYAACPYRAESGPAAGRRRQLSRFNRELLAYAISAGSRDAVRLSFCLPRLLRSMVDSRYAREAGALGPAAVYWIQLLRTSREVAAAKPSARVSSGVE